ncbi:MAG: chromate resistance protein [Rubrivivax sp.]|nr:chromate resistance protein [Rubrivivax sp.]
MLWHLLVLSLPTANATVRMRAWRALKAAGAAVLRDGVYALPNDDVQGDAHGRTLAAVAADVRGHGGMARLLRADGVDEDLRPLFDRAADYGALLSEVTALRGATDAGAALRKLRKRFEQITAIDFFPAEAQRQAAAALADAEAAAARALAPGEPQPARRSIERLDRAAYRGRLWATRARPWVDRLACAWLIRRCIDPEARFLWLASPADCPAQALGFDFDGAAFSHVGARVSFEVLLASFALETPALLRLGVLVHGLDVGGVMPPEAAGVEGVLAGMRQAIADDDQLMLAAAGVFEGLWITFEKEAAA